MKILLIGGACDGMRIELDIDRVQPGRTIDVRVPDMFIARLDTLPKHPEMFMTVQHEHYTLNVFIERGLSWYAGVHAEIKSPLYHLIQRYPEFVGTENAARTWRGKPLNDLSKRELIDIIVLEITSRYVDSALRKDM